MNEPKDGQVMAPIPHAGRMEEMLIKHLKVSSAFGAGEARNIALRCARVRTGDILIWLEMMVARTRIASHKVSIEYVRQEIKKVFSHE